MRERYLERVEPTAEAVDQWTTHVYDSARRLLLTQVDSLSLIHI